MNKYKEKSKYDEDRFKKEDDEYLLKEARPIVEDNINRLDKNKLFLFIEDVLTNKRLTSVLYASNAKIEIKTYLKTKKNFYRKQDELEKKRKAKNEPSSVVKRRSRKEAYIQMRTAIDDFKLQKKEYTQGLTENNDRKLKAIRDELAKEKKKYYGDLKTNYINGFRRAYSRIKDKIDEMNEIKEEEMKYKIVNKSKNKETMYTEPGCPKSIAGKERMIHFPDVKLNIKNVYSRLYNNAVLPPEIEKKKDKKNKSKRPFSASIKRSLMLKKVEAGPKINFNLKNVLKSNNGKEFTIKVTKKILQKCFNKYSGGPTTLKYIKNQPTNENEKNKEENNFYMVNYYNLVDQSGNSFLHMATIENYPQMVKYFIEKGADINMQNNEGNTPLHLALQKKHKDIIKILMDNKAALDIPNCDGDIQFEYFTPEMKKEYGVDKLLVINPVKKK